MTSERTEGAWERIVDEQTTLSGAQAEVISLQRETIALLRHIITELKAHAIARQELTDITATLKE